MNKKTPWWSEKSGFFGNFYIEGDDSIEGYLSRKKQSLKQRTSTEIGGIIKLLSLKRDSKILDCPCGYGRHSIGLTQEGMIVTGSDINSTHLKKALSDSKKEKVEIKFIKENMIGIRYKNEFDAVINMFYSFGFFDTDKENEKVLKNFFKALKKGGKLLMHTDVNIPRIISGKYKEKETRILNNGKTLKIIDEYDLNTKRINGAWIIKNNAKESKKEYSVRVYTKEEFTTLCRKAGFSEVKAYSDWSGKPYSKNSEDMIIVATK